MHGVDMVTVAELLGHALVETAAGYAHLSDGHLVQAAETVGALSARAMLLPRPAAASPGDVSRHDYYKITLYRDYDMSKRYYPAQRFPLTSPLGTHLRHVLAIRYNARIKLSFTGNDINPARAGRLCNPRR